MAISELHVGLHAAFLSNGSSNLLQASEQRSEKAYQYMHQWRVYRRAKVGLFRSARPNLLTTGD